MSAEYTGFMCQDFWPQCLKSEGVFSQPVYEPFSNVIIQANDWLRVNRKWKITTCESIEIKYEGEDMEFNKMTNFEYGKHHTRYLRGLRLWLTELEDDRNKEQQIGYLNLIPDKVEKSGCCALASYETLDEVIAQFNSTIRRNPLPGRVITIETQKMKIKSQFDPDLSFWIEGGMLNKFFLFIIRIFYEVVPGNLEEIGIKDFVPEKLKSGGWCSHPKYELLSSLVDKASSWSAWKGDIRVCNVQSVNIRIKSGQEVDTQKMNYIEHSHGFTPYVRIVRVAYAMSPDQYPDNETLTTGRIVCMFFTPEEISRSLFSSKHEDLPLVKEKISAWIKSTGSRVLSAETAALRMYTGGEAELGADATYTYNVGNVSEKWLFAIRLYLHAI